MLKGSDSEIHDKTAKITNYLKQLISKMNTTKFSTVIVILMLKSKIIQETKVLIYHIINSWDLWGLTWPDRGVMSLRPLWSPDADHETTTRPKKPCCLTTFSWITLSLWSNSWTVSSLESYNNPDNAFDIVQYCNLNVSRTFIKCHSVC